MFLKLSALKFINLISNFKACVNSCMYNLVKSHNTLILKQATWIKMGMLTLINLLYNETKYVTLSCK